MALTYYWKEIKMSKPSFESMFSVLFKIDREIRYASVIEKSGKVIAGGMRKGVRPLEPKEEELRLMAHIVSESTTRETWDKYFGKTTYTIVKRAKVILMIFPYENRLAFVTAEPTFSLQKISEIRDILNEYIQY